MLYSEERTHSDASSVLVPTPQPPRDRWQACAVGSNASYPPPAGDPCECTSVHPRTRLKNNIQKIKKIKFAEQKKYTAPSTLNTMCLLK